MAKFIEVKYNGRHILINVGNIAFIEPSLNNKEETSIKLNCATTPTGGRVILCDENYNTLLTRLSLIADVDIVE